MTPYYSDDHVTLYHGDWREAPAGLLTADVLVTDPPYGTGGWRRNAAGQGGNPTGTLVQEAWDDGATEWLTLASDRPVLTFWPAATTHRLLSDAVRHGFDKHRALYMVKRDPKPMPKGRTQWSVEPIWCLSRDGFVLYGGTDFMECSTPRLGRDSDATGHPYQKPLEVMTWLLSKVDAESVLDPFAGSGTTLVAAKSLGMKAIGVERDEAYCEVAANRLRQEVLGLTA